VLQPPKSSLSPTPTSKGFRPRKRALAQTRDEFVRAAERAIEDMVRKGAATPERNRRDRTGARKAAVVELGHSTLAVTETYLHHRPRHDTAARVQALVDAATAPQLQAVTQASKEVAA
jgi:hypothetical protein